MKGTLISGLVIIGLFAGDTTPAQSPAGTAFTYQGQLKQNGIPVNNANGRFQFKLFDADTGGNQVGNTVSFTGVDISNGLFMVILDFGAGAFAADARWLEVGVYESGTGWVTLSPRQQVTPTPYAMTAANLTLPFAATVPEIAEDAFTVDYAGWGYAIRATSTGPDAVAIYGSTSADDTVAIQGQATGLVSTAVQGYASAIGPDAANVGGWFGAQGEQGKGVYASAMATSGTNYGVYGRTSSPQGYGGYFEGRGYFSGNVGIGVEEPTEKLNVAGLIKTTGFQLATTPTSGYVLTCDATGVGTWQPAGAGSCLWQLNGSDIYYDAGKVGIGTTTPMVPLQVTDTAGGFAAVAGEKPGESSYGYLGHEFAGVYGLNNAAYPDGRAVYGQATGPGGFGGYFEGRGYFSDNVGIGTSAPTYPLHVTSTAARAVYAENAATSGASFAVYGRSTGTGGRGVYGEATAGSGTTSGVEGYAYSPTGHAVYGYNEAESGYGYAIRGDNISPNGIAVFGYAANDTGTGVTYGVMGQIDNSAGSAVYGIATASTGTGHGVYGSSASENGAGVYGCATSSGYGVRGDSIGGNGVYGYSAEKWAIFGAAPYGSNYGGILGGIANHTGGVLTKSNSGVSGSCEAGQGVAGQTYSGVGVWGEQVNSGNMGHLGGSDAGAYGQTANAGDYGVWGHSTNSDGYAGYFTGGMNYFEGPVGIGVIPVLDPKLHVSTSHNMAIYGESSNNNAHAVVGFATATSGEAYGVYGFATSPSGAAVCGETTTTDCSAIKGLSLGNPGTGGWFKSDAGNGVYAESNSTTSSAIRAVHTSTAPGSAFIPAVYGVHAEADGIGIGVMGRGGYRGVEGIVEQPAGASDYYGVYGYVSGGSGINRGLYGEAQGSFANGADYGVYGTASGSGSGASLGVYGSATGSGYNYGVFGTASGGMTNYAGYFSGNVSVTGTLSKGGGSFKIDHPLDPANKYLYHSFVESPEMMNVYNGNVELDAAGEAVVVLPEWFEALNRDYRYQLTCIGGFAPVYIAQEITGNQFKIAGGRPGLKVSWQVTGVRQDAFANANRIPVEEDKPDDELGTYLHPEAFGMSPELQVDRVREAREQAEVDVVPQDQ